MKRKGQRYLGVDLHHDSFVVCLRQQQRVVEFRSWRTDLTEAVAKLSRPYGTQRFFPLYPTLRLRLRAGLDYSAPRALFWLLLVPPMQRRTEFRNSLNWGRRFRSVLG